MKTKNGILGYISLLLCNNPGVFICIAVCLLPGLTLADDEQPYISNDPTKAQQAGPAINLQPKNQGKGFELPPLPKQGELEKNSKTIQINQVEFAGNTVFSGAELQNLLLSYLNHPITAGDLESMRRILTQYYIDHGFVNSGALLISQSVADGVLRMKIIEGRLTEVQQSGQEGLPEYYIKDRLIAGSGDPLNVADLQQSYRQLLSDPMIGQLNGRLLPGVHPGEAVLDVQVKRNRPYQFYAGADDYATPAVGSYAGRMGGWVDNLAGFGERIDGQFIANGNSLGYNAGFSVPVSAQDTKLSFRFSQTNSTLTEGSSNPLNISSRITGFDGAISHPVYRTLNDNLVLGLNFVVRQSHSLLENSCQLGANFSGIIGDTSCHSQVTVLRMSQKYSHKGETNSGAFYSTFNVGINALGATPTQSGGQSGQFFSWLGQSMFNQLLWDNGLQLQARGNLQLANSPLLPLERFAVGGVYTARGYQENSFIRDNGFNTNLEIKYPVYGGVNNNKSSLFLIPFIDYAGAWNNASIAQQSTYNYLFSSGIGFNWQYKQVTADFYWGHAFNAVIPKPTTKSIQDDGIHFRVNFMAF